MRYWTGVVSGIGLMGLILGVAAVPLTGTADEAEGGGTDPYFDESRIPWLTVGDDPAAQAREEGQPLLYYFHAQWCSWCRAYQAETLEDPDVVRVLSRDFVAVEVDLDRRRDLFSEFGGRGLPYTVVTTPEGEMMFRVTGHLAASDLVSVLERAHAAVQEGEPQRLEPPEETYPLAVDEFREWMEDLYDPGLQRFSNTSFRGDTGKRPQPLTYLSLQADPEWRDAVEAVLETTIRDLHDPVEGGFFYFADPDTVTGVPEVETAKVLDLNARMTWAFIDAYERFGETRYREVAEAGLDYMKETLWDDTDGGFWGSQYSDNEYFELETLEARQAHGAPAVERAKFTDFNAQAVVAFARAAMVFDEPDYLEVARETLAFIEEEMQDPGGGYYHTWEDGEARVSGFLPDQAWLAAALWQVHRAAGDGEPPPQLTALVRHMLEDYTQGVDGFAERRPEMVEEPFIQPRTNAVLAWLFADMAAAGVEIEPDLAAARERAMAGTEWRQGSDPDEVVLAIYAETLASDRVAARVEQGAHE